MGTLRLTVFVVILLGASASARGQKDAAHPDLSGTWKLNVARSKIPKDGSADSQTIHIDCVGSVIVINLTADATDQSQKFVTDGKQHIVAETSGRVLESGGTRVIHVAYWKKSSLVTETIVLDVTDAGASIPLSTSAERWTLSKDGDRLSRETDNVMQVRVYDKSN